MRKRYGRKCFIHNALLPNRRIPTPKFWLISSRCALQSSDEAKESSETSESSINAFKKNMSSSLPSLPDLSSFYQYFPDSKEKVQQIAGQISELWQLAKNPDIPLHTQSAITSVNDLLFQLLEQTSVFPDEKPVSIPTSPPFDPILSLHLAAYAFRAYMEPSEATYREIVVSSLPTSPEEKIYNHLAFADTSFIASSATGLFMIRLEGDIEDAYLTATVNDGISLDLLKLKHITILRRAQNCHDGTKELSDVLTLNLYHSREDYVSLAEPVCCVSVDVREIVHRALKTGDTGHGDFKELCFHPPEHGESRSNSLKFSWPSDLDLKLPSFPFSNDRAQDSDRDDEHKYNVSIQVSFVPFSEKERDPSQTSNASPGSSTYMSVRSSNFDNVARKALEAFQTAVQRASKQNLQEEQNLAETDREIRDIVKQLLRAKLPAGSMPTPSNWKRFIVAAASLYKTIEGSRLIESTTTLNEQLNETLFVEAMSTDTQIWLYRDSLKKNLVVSFRGTEQVKWRDFFTDAQTFLQRWVPGEDVDLTINGSNTVGLDAFVPSILPTTKVSAAIPDDATAVHYGFLRAYYSVQKVLLRHILLLTSNLQEDYTIYFTGHSLGGALAIVSAADFVARHRWGKVCCMSYGAPKVGNINFARRFNELVPNSFRIVNDKDLVSRMPRSVSEGKHVSKYRHSGRTVLINDEGEYWVEGRAGSPYKNGKSVFDVLHERCANLSDLLEIEQRLWDNLLSGKSVQHHMECSYFSTMHEAVKRYIRDSKS